MVSTYRVPSANSLDLPQFRLRIKSIMYLPLLPLSSRVFPSPEKNKSEKMRRNIQIKYFNVFFLGYVYIRRNFVCRTRWEIHGKCLARKWCFVPFCPSRTHNFHYKGQRFSCRGDDTHMACDGCCFFHKKKRVSAKNIRRRPFRDFFQSPPTHLLAYFVAENFNFNVLFLSRHSSHNLTSVE